MNFYLDYSEIGKQTGRRNISNLKYAGTTNLLVKNEEAGPPPTPGPKMSALELSI